VLDATRTGLARYVPHTPSYAFGQRYRQMVLTGGGDVSAKRLELARTVA
jgi:hypothetical protein